jgi:LmbE family N-acetylglucosaminyl deacetylase
MFGKNILILVPHPDDEIVACAATISHAKKAGSNIHVLYLTHGCIGRNVMWPWQRRNYDMIVAYRQFEAEKAADCLDIEPVGYSQRPARFVWKQMQAVYEEIQRAVEHNKIDQLWVPAYEGGNPDHDAVNAIAQKIQMENGVLEFAEYNFFNKQTNSQIFPFPNGTEKTIQLTPSEQKHKRAALRLYKSEKGNLNYVGTTHECYRPLAEYDYSKPPHPGKLWYARFQWVPFKHPRVDFTKPMDVCRAIEGFFTKE